VEIVLRRPYGYNGGPGGCKICGILANIVVALVDALIFWRPMLPLVESVAAPDDAVATPCDPVVAAPSDPGAAPDYPVAALTILWRPLWM
jgi:hypothetical protein